VIFGGLLIALGLVGYLGSDRASITALIPALFGLVLVALGLLARKERLRMHVMHAAVLVGLIGFLVPAVRTFGKIPDLVSTGRVMVTRDGVETDATFAVVMQLLMALICAVFVGLCIKSFIDARRARRAAAVQG
jgi:small-conductance mechanosensitive channel